MSTRQEAADWLIAATIATEVPPMPVTKRGEDGRPSTFTADMIEPAIRAVADVISNRTADPQFPDTALAVCWYGAPPGDGRANAFSGVGHEYWWRAVEGLWFPRHVERCLEIWRDPQLEPIAGGALYYYSPASMQPPFRVPSWAHRLTEVQVAGIDRTFFRWYG